MKRALPLAALALACGILVPSDPRSEKEQMRDLYRQGPESVAAILKEASASHATTEIRTQVTGGIEVIIVDGEGSSVTRQLLDRDGTVVDDLTITLDPDGTLHSQGEIGSGHRVGSVAPPLEEEPFRIRDSAKDGYGGWTHGDHDSTSSQLAWQRTMGSMGRISKVLADNE